MRCVHACKAEWFKKVERYHREEAFRKVATHGGYYTEAEMKKPVSEGGLGKSAFLGCTGWLVRAS